MCKGWNYFKNHLDRCQRSGTFRQQCTLDVVSVIVSSKNLRKKKKKIVEKIPVIRERKKKMYLIVPYLHQIRKCAVHNSIYCGTDSRKELFNLWTGKHETGGDRSLFVLVIVSSYNYVKP